jgi:hypothetical protein
LGKSRDVNLVEYERQKRKSERIHGREEGENPRAEEGERVGENSLDYLEPP